MTTKSATIRMPQRRSYTTRTPRKPHQGPSVNIFQSSLRGVLTFLILLLFLGLSVFASYKVKSVANDISVLEQRYATIQEENLQLKKRFSKMTSKATLAKIGKRLGLRPPAEDQIITLPE